MAKERNHLIDIIKGIAIICVIYCHGIGGWNFATGTYYVALRKMWKLESVL